MDCLEDALVETESGNLKSEAVVKIHSTMQQYLSYKNFDYK